MRKFSSFEQEVITRLIELDAEEDLAITLPNLIERLYSKGIPDYYYIEVNPNKDVVLQIKSTDYVPAKIEAAEHNVSRIVLPTVLLFEYLAANGFARFTGNLKQTAIGKKYVNESYTRCDFLDSEIKEIIYKYTQKRIYLTEALRVFVASGFKTEEALRHEEELGAIKLQLKITILALIISTVGLLASILLPIFNSSAVRLVNDKVTLSITINKNEEISPEALQEIIQDASTLIESKSAKP